MSPAAEITQEEARELRREVAELRAERSNGVGIIAAAIMAIPMAYVIGKAVGLAQRPTLKERAGTWLIERGLELGGLL